MSVNFNLWSLLFRIFYVFILELFGSQRQLKKAIILFIKDSMSVNFNFVVSPF